MPRRWLELGRTNDAVWGRIKGTANEPYQVAIDLQTSSATCTCPSRRRPCKHAVGLTMLNAAAPPAEAPPPEWLAASLQQRQKPAERRAIVDPERAAARARRREQRITEGVDDLQRWLEDLLRAGLAEAASRPWRSFEQMSARLVDAQAPGLARYVRELGSLPYGVRDWPERMVIELGQVWLLLTAWRRLQELEPGLRADVRSLVGLNEARDDVLDRPPEHDAWDVLGRRVIEGERMLVQRTWLWGRNSQRWALLLDFDPGGQPVEHGLAPGQSFEADLCFYAGAAPLRALVRGAPRQVDAVATLPGCSVASAMRAYAESLGRNPWQERTPLALASVVPMRRDGAWSVTDEQHHMVELSGPAGWQLLAVSGGQPIDVFGEFNGFSLHPLSVAYNGRLVPLRDVAET